MAGPLQPTLWQLGRHMLIGFHSPKNDIWHHVANNKTSLPWFFNKKFKQPREQFKALPTKKLQTDY